MGNVKKSVSERTRHQRQYNRRVNKRQLQTQESKIDPGKAVDNGLVVMRSNEIESKVQDDSSRSGNDTDLLMIHISDPYITKSQLLSNYGILGRYDVSVPALIKDHKGNKIKYAVSRRRQYAVFKLYGNKIFWKIPNVVPTLRNPRYA
ncbi:hypothetical protein Tco_0621920, partial [Tanacetum coccineum]